MRRRIAIVVAAVTAMVALAFLIPLAGLVRDLARDRVLLGAERDAQTLALILTVLIPQQGFEGVEAVVEGNRPNDEKVSVIFADGRVAGEPTVIDTNVLQARDGSSFRAAVEGGEAVFVPVIAEDGGSSVVRVFVPSDQLQQNVLVAWVTLGLLGLFLVALAIAVADRLARSLVTPVRELSDAAHRLGEGDLDVRVRPAGPPEIVEVGGAFNRLASRIGNLLQQERESAADLSHRLRTPLTAVRLDAEAFSHTEAGQRLIEDLDELDRTVDHVIREARRPSREGADAATNLASVVQERAAFWGALADEQNRPWTLEIERPGPYTVAARSADLEAVTDALLGNVFAHTPEGVGFYLAVARFGDDRIRLIMEDNGPGFPQDALQRGWSGAGSTGLGLDIVRRTAEASGGTATFTSRQPHGARVVVELPSPSY